MSGSVSTSDHRHGVSAQAAVTVRAGWTSGYLHVAVVVDRLCALVVGLAALEVRFDGGGFVPAGYFGFTVVLPLLWLGSVAIAGGYDRRFVGVGSEEFRKVLNAAVSMTAGIAIVSYAAKLDLAAPAPNNL
jgi:hypothetical protein